jgi:hypothetical protein
MFRPSHLASRPRRYAFPNRPDPNNNLSCVQVLPWARGGDAPALRPNWRSPLLRSGRLTMLERCGQQPTRDSRRRSHGANLS